MNLFSYQEMDDIRYEHFKRDFFFFFVTYLFFMFVEEKYKKNKKQLSKFLTLNHLLEVHN